MAKIRGLRPYPNVEQPPLLLTKVTEVSQCCYQDQTFQDQDQDQDQKVQDQDLASPNKVNATTER